jgi:hypothetical protein
MPNFAFHLTVLDKVTEQLIAAGDPRGDLMKTNRPFAALGALGPDLLRYSPISSGLSDALSGLVTSAGNVSSLPMSLLAELFLNPVGAAYALLFRDLVVPFWQTINEINALLDKLDAIAAAQSELAIPGVIGQVQKMLTQSQQLQNALPQTVQNLANVIGQFIALPPWMEQSLTFPVPPSDPRANRLSEFLRWHNSGTFAANLLAAAKSDEEKAFALGWLCHVAGSVTGEPFINNIAGGPYRTHWWRNRLASNFVDAWTFGFYQTNASMAGNQPTPPYEQWSALCTANVQEAFNVAGFSVGAGGDVPDAVKVMASGNLGSLPAQFPPAIAKLLETAVNETYPAPTQPIAGFSADTFANAAVGAFAVYWFMTSGSGPTGLNPLGPPPTTCLTPPNWISTGSTPSPQQAGLNPSGAACAILLAIIALLFFALGDFPAGTAALLAALSAPAIDWATVTCNLFWLRSTLVSAEDALRDALVKSGLAYPPPVKLGTVDANGNAQSALDLTPPTGVPLTQANAESIGIWQPSAYPRSLDTSQGAADLNFNSYPLTQVEQPDTSSLIQFGAYANAVVDGSGLQNGGIVNAGAFPTLNQFFGDAVSNAVQLITDGPGKLPNYNLDADRGDGWTGWHPQPGSMPSTPPVLAVHD